MASDQLKSSGPCRVYFFINGHGVIGTRIRTTTDVNLIPTGNAFRAEVEVPRSPIP